MTNYYTIYTQRMAGYLMMNGFVLKGIIQQPLERFNQFIFVDSPELRSKMAEYKRQAKESVN